MTTLIQRDIPDNYLRNSDFELGDTFWMVDGIWISTNFGVDVDSPCAMRGFEGTSGGYWGGIIHKDFIAVHPHESVHQGGYFYSSVGITGRVELLEYDAAYKFIRNQVYDVSIPANTWIWIHAIFQVSYDSQFIRAKFVFKTGDAGTRRLSCPFLRMGKSEITFDAIIREKYVAINKDTTLPAGAIETVTISPLIGEYYKLINVYLFAPNPSGSTSGTHWFNIRNDTYATLEYVFVAHNYGNATGLRMFIPYPPAGINRYYPDDKGAFGESLRSITVTSDSKINITYKNETNVSQTGTRLYRFLFEVLRKYESVDVG